MLAWAKAWAMLQPQAHRLDDALEAGCGDSLVMSAAAAAPLPDAVALLKAVACEKAHHEHLNDDTFEAALWTAAQRARLPVPDAIADPQAHIAQKRAALLALADLDNLLTDHMPQDKALAPRLKLAILRRLGGQLDHQTGLDVEYEDDMRALFEMAKRRVSWPVAQDDVERDQIATLAATLDLLTPGDWGFDAMVADASGHDLVHFQLLEALDHYAAGRRLEAAAGLASADPGQAQQAGA